jgi:hypothetical protein
VSNHDVASRRDDRHLARAAPGGETYTTELPAMTDAFGQTLDPRDGMDGLGGRAAAGSRALHRETSRRDRDVLTEGSGLPNQRAPCHHAM